VKVRHMYLNYFSKRCRHKTVTKGLKIN
jgi:hypothetical protein